MVLWVNEYECVCVRALEFGTVANGFFFSSHSYYRSFFGIHFNIVELSAYSLINLFAYPPSLPNGFGWKKLTTNWKYVATNWICVRILASAQMYIMFGILLQNVYMQM